MDKNAEDGDKQFLEFVVQSIVDNPEEVKIDRSVDEMGVLLTLSVHPDDMGKIIGRQGNTARAIRTLLRVVGLKNNARVNLKINEPEGSTRAQAHSVEDAMNELKDERE
ncbi:MAG: KH domain-containing protein [Candidatus Campbellbacteria bacterium]|nr:KH domain-containing protein [Candidatus Campbellbacteria bacterium]